MCEILGFSSNCNKDINSYLNEFYSHCPEHPNGWGLAKFDEDSAEVDTEPVSADSSLLLSQLLSNHVTSKTVLAHIRKATVGGVNKENCHPFVRVDASGRSWTLMHNGTIFNGLELIEYKDKQAGDTDSERILLYLIDQINDDFSKKGCELSALERFQAVERVVLALSHRNKINLIIYDGEQMYVHVNMKDTLFVKNEDNSALFSTVPLDDSGWEPLPLNTLLAYQNGELEYKGEKHQNEYVDAMFNMDQLCDYNI